jgi:sulfatase modifying factor 1
MDSQLELYRLHDAQVLHQRAIHWLHQDDRDKAASALDRAYGLQPEHQEVAELRRQVLDSLQREVDGVTYRYVPGGYFLLGSKTGEADERPVRLTQVDAFWMAEVPVDWEQFCRGMGYELPPRGFDSERQDYELTKIKLQYCEDQTTRAEDWHSHHAAADPTAFQPPRSPTSDRVHSWKLKPVVAVTCGQAEQFCSNLGLRLPSEAEWEKAARGGLIDQPYAWGDAPPSEENCDFHRFDQFSIQPSRRYPPNGYGLYAMCGGVWEWTSTRYDALAYRGHPTPADAPERVVRGGSWADCAEACTVSFRGSQIKTDSDWWATPNVGFRACLR